jgi:hypothetical protein
VSAPRCGAGLPRSLKTEPYPAKRCAGPERLLVPPTGSNARNMAAQAAWPTSQAVRVSAEGFKLESLILAQNER